DNSNHKNANGLTLPQRENQIQDRRSCGSGHPSPGGFPVGSQRVQAGFLMCLCRHVFWFLPTVWILLRALWLRLGTRANLRTHDSPSAFFAWLLTIALAMTLTTKVITNNIRPAAISSDWRWPKASGKFNAISDGMVVLAPDVTSDQEKPPAESTMVTAMVSPSARPKANMIDEMTPARANGKTVILIISQRVAPSPSAASCCRCGV